mmetsp:Transcript_39094/g.84732  ORF Transcript_39094/g.84732 Transcript_39094/m.84732 type:complete len:126 (+) Transcript_39094:328-705(+)
MLLRAAHRRTFLTPESTPSLNRLSMLYGWLIFAELESDLFDCLIQDLGRLLLAKPGKSRVRDRRGLQVPACEVPFDIPNYVVYPNATVPKVFSGHWALRVVLKQARVRRERAEQKDYSHSEHQQQ